MNTSKTRTRWERLIRPIKPTPQEDLHASKPWKRGCRKRRGDFALVPELSLSDSGTISQDFIGHGWLIHLRTSVNRRELKLELKYRQKVLSPTPSLTDSQQCQMSQKGHQNFIMRLKDSHQLQLWVSKDLISSSRTTLDSFHLFSRCFVFTQEAWQNRSAISTVVWCRKRRPSSLLRFILLLGLP